MLIFIWKHLKLIKIKMCQKNSKRRYLNSLSCLLKYSISTPGKLHPYLKSTPTRLGQWTASYRSYRALWGQTLWAWDTKRATYSPFRPFQRQLRQQDPLWANSSTTSQDMQMVVGRYYSYLWRAYHISQSILCSQIDTKWFITHKRDYCGLITFLLEDTPMSMGSAQCKGWIPNAIHKNLILRYKSVGLFNVSFCSYEPLTG